MHIPLEAGDIQVTETPHEPAHADTNWGAHAQVRADQSGNPRTYEL